MDAPRKRPAKNGSKRSQTTDPVRSASLLGFIKRKPTQTFGILGLIALMGGAVVNVMFLQEARHPHPLFGKTVETQAPRGAVSPIAPPVQQAAVPAPAPRPASFTPAQVEKPVARAPIAEPVESVKEQPKSRDAIAALIRGNVPQVAATTAPDASKTVLAAQKALVKLGFVLKPDGVMGGTTRQAIEIYERNHKMPVRGDLTPKIMGLLSAESGIRVE